MGCTNSIIQIPRPSPNLVISLSAIPSHEKNVPVDRIIPRRAGGRRIRPGPANVPVYGMVGALCRGSGECLWGANRKRFGKGAVVRGGRGRDRLLPVPERSIISVGYEGYCHWEGGLAIPVC